MIRIRESFGAKLLSAFIGTIGIPLIATILVARAVTDRQVEEVAARTVQNAGRLFEERGEVQRQLVATLARPFTDGSRALARLNSAIEENDVEFLAGEVAFEMELQNLPEALLVFTGPDGAPVLSLIRDRQFVDEDPAGIRPLAEELLMSDAPELQAYRVVDGTMYNVRAVYLELGYRPIGTVAVGLPVSAADLEAVSDVGGFEACLAWNGRCIVESGGVDAQLRDAMVASLGLDAPRRVQSDDGEWSVRAEPLIEGRPEEGHRVVAVPLDPVLAPFSSILRALVFSVTGALVLAILFGTLMSRSFTRPVRALVDATGRVAGGDYQTEVSVDSRDEMGTLADAFNEMTRGLKMREQYRSVLSKVVSQDIAEELMKGDVELGGENREVTVLFGDIRGFTPLTEGMEPQDVIALLNECMEHLASAVDAEGGVVDKFIGDELMAVFGAPVRQEDHALRAVRAALRMREGIREMNRRRTERGEGELRIGIGIATGVAVAGNMGSSDRMNYTVLGSTVNLAARLTSAARPGEILVNADTHEAVGEAFVATALGGRELKGFSAEVQIFAVEGPAVSPSEEVGILA